MLVRFPSHVYKSVPISITVLTPLSIVSKLVLSITIHPTKLDSVNSVSMVVITVQIALIVLPAMRDICLSRMKIPVLSSVR